MVDWWRQLSKILMRGSVFTKMFKHDGWNIVALEAYDSFMAFNLSNHGWGEGGRCTPLPPLLLAFYLKCLEATHTWKFLTLQTFCCGCPFEKKSNILVLPPLRAFEKSVQKPPVLGTVKVCLYCKMNSGSLCLFPCCPLSRLRGVLVGLLMSWLCIYNISTIFFRLWYRQNNMCNKQFD